MADKKKMICNIVFLILVFTGTLYGVFHGEDLGEIVHILKTVNPLWLIPGVICVVVILSRLVDTFSSRILYPMLLLSGNHSIAVV